MSREALVSAAGAAKTVASSHLLQRKSAGGNHAAIGEMHDAVKKGKSKCKPVPRVSVELGYKHLLSSGSETHPKKLPPTDYVGVTATFHF